MDQNETFVFFLAALGLSWGTRDLLVAARMWDPIPRPGIEPGHPLPWERGVLATRLPGKSPNFRIFYIFSTHCFFHLGRLTALFFATTI